MPGRRRLAGGGGKTRDGGGETGRAGAGEAARRAASGAKMATVTMSLCAWKHSYELFFSCARAAAVSVASARLATRCSLRRWLPAFQTPFHLACHFLLTYIHQVHGRHLCRSVPTLGTSW